MFTIHEARRIITMDPAQPTATALALQGSEIVYVGDDAGVAPFVGPRTRVVSGGNLTVLPGLTDAHAHLSGLGLSLSKLELRGELSAALIIAKVQQAAQRYGFVIRPEITNSVPGDLGGYAPLNVARIQGIHSGPLYHTSGDVLESISTPGLEKAARFYAYLIEHAMTMPKGDINP